MGLDERVSARRDASPASAFICHCVSLGRGRPSIQSCPQQQRCFYFQKTGCVSCPSRFRCRLSATRCERARPGLREAEQLAELARRTRRTLGAL